MLKMSSITAENYHLKWDSHLSYLNLSLNSLYKNEKYADVMLLASNLDSSGPPIPAHRIILSASSHFFSTIFEGLSSHSNNPIYVVLPPELSRKAIQILVQYMYIGEATVSNDILTEVLRGGEILKIRGLCRNQNARENNFHSNEFKTSSHVSSQNCMGHSDNIGGIHEPELRGLGASATVIPKESPVIVMSPKIPQTQSVVPGPPLSTPSIMVNKEYAIDPDESNKIPSFGAATSHLSRIAKKLQTTNCSSPVNRTYHSSSHESAYSRDRERLRRHSEDALLCSRSSDMCRDEVINMSRRISSDQDIMDRALHRKTSVPEQRNHSMENEIFRKDPNPFASECPLEDSLSETLDLIPIKEEPSDWTGEHGVDCVSSSCKQTPLDMVKIETSLSDEEGKQDVENSGNPVYSPLSCELCSETFTQPADWVRHIESHMDSASKYIPKKRKRVASSSADMIASLKCDLCNTQYETPADWVRHIQNTHTETELAISNNSELPKSRRPIIERFVPKDSSKCTSRQRCSSPEYYRTVPPKKTRTALTDYQMFIDKTCDICNKDFPTYAMMISHRKTHICDAFPK